MTDWVFPLAVENSSQGREDGGEQFKLLGQGAQDIRAYDVVKDVQRVEQLVGIHPGRQLLRFKRELREAGLTDNSVTTYVDRTGHFLRWLESEYQPRGSNVRCQAPVPAGTGPIQPNVEPSHRQPGRRRLPQPAQAHHPQVSGTRRGLGGEGRRDRRRGPPQRGRYAERRCGPQRLCLWLRRIRRWPRREDQRSRRLASAQVREHPFRRPQIPRRVLGQPQG